jgi:hypothetical protein
MARSISEILRIELANAIEPAAGCWPLSKFFALTKSHNQVAALLPREDPVQQLISIKTTSELQFVPRI